MNKYLIFFLPCLAVFSFSNVGEIQAQQEMLTFLFFNVENLYDTVDDPYSGDQGFLPGSVKVWDKKRYDRKISDLARVFSEAGGKSLPEVIGLCEVENSRVLEDLMHSPRMSAGKYRYVHYNDRDSRGIDLALLYRPSAFRLISGNLLRVRNSKGGIFARGILYVTGSLSNGEILHVFVNHWPARTGNSDLREQSRKEMAAGLRKLTRDILDREKSALIVIMGDMNDEPGDPSLREILEAAAPGKYSRSGLVNLMIPAWQKGEGTVLYNRDWKMLDNLVVSESLLDWKGFRVEGNRGYVFRAPWMEFRAPNGQQSPRRTYSGNQYSGGVSDHFPVYFRLITSPP